MQPDAANELRLLEQVEFKVALANSKDELQKVLGDLLVPSLLKLASPHAIVRQKVS